MRNGDLYIKWNGEEYRFLGISTPLSGIEEKPAKLYERGSAIIEDTNNQVFIYDLDENPLITCEDNKFFYTDSAIPYVLYQNIYNEKLGACDIEGFNGFVDRGKCVNKKRFSWQPNIFSFLEMEC